MATSASGAGSSLRERFENAVLAAGFRIVDARSVSGHLLEYDLLAPGRAGELRLEVQLKCLRRLPLLGHLAVFREHIRGPASERKRVLLAYEAQLGVYAGWAGRRVRPLGVPVVLRAHRQALERAQQEGVAPLSRGGQRPGTARLALRPERIGELLAALVPEPPAAPSIAVRPRLPLRDFGGEPVQTAETPDALVQGAPIPEASVSEPPAALSRRPTVATGFAKPNDPVPPLTGEEPLEPGYNYWFWFEVGVDIRDSIERRPTPLPALPAGQHLVVQLYGFPGELKLSGERTGEIVLNEDGSARVIRPAAQVRGAGRLPRRRLFFPVRTPTTTGLFRMRCNIYLGSTLVQSRLISCDVGSRSSSDLLALRSELDYALSDTLTLQALERVPRHDLSVLVNGDGTSHELRFFSARGEQLFAHDASLESLAIDGAIEQARGALRHASWGTRDEWNGDLNAYRYAKQDPARFQEDLVDLAREGRRLYVGIARELSGGPEGRAALERVAALPGRVQIATLAHGLYVPAGLFYDHRLEDAPAPTRKYSLCPEFEAALAGPEPLRQLRCFAEGCELGDDPYVVCASGFWGFRHELGWPTGTAEPMREIACDDGAPELAIGVSTDPLLGRRPAHMQRISALGRASIAERRAELTPLLERSPHLVYLFCHGGVSEGGSPYVEIGPPGEDDAITAVYLANEGIHWSRRRPVVFVNGCYTTALEPRQILDLVAAFVGEANAAGVIGTELTVFESLACAFAETMLAAFLDGSASIGSAVREARLAVLKTSNPLGLVYVPFVAADVRLVGAPASTGRPPPPPATF